MPFRGLTWERGLSLGAYSAVASPTRGFGPGNGAGTQAMPSVRDYYQRPQLDAGTRVTSTLAWMVC